MFINYDQIIYDLLDELKGQKKYDVEMYYKVRTVGLGGFCQENESLLSYFEGKIETLDFVIEKIRNTLDIF